VQGTSSECLRVGTALRTLSARGARISSVLRGLHRTTIPVALLLREERLRQNARECSYTSIGGVSQVQTTTTERKPRSRRPRVCRQNGRIAGTQGLVEVV